MKRTQQDPPVCERHFDTVAKFRTRMHIEMAACGGVPKPTKTHNHAGALKQSQLTVQERCASITFVRIRMIPRRSALHSRSDPSIDEAKPIVGRYRRRLIGKPGAVHRPEQPFSTAITSEDATGAIGTMRSRRQTQNDDTPLRVTESRYRSTPVRLTAICRSLFGGDLLAPCHESRACSAIDHI